MEKGIATSRRAVEIRLKTRSPQFRCLYSNNSSVDLIIVRISTPWKGQHERKIKDNAIRLSDDKARLPRIWTTERNGTMQRRMVSLEYWICRTAGRVKKKHSIGTRSPSHATASVFVDVNSDILTTSRHMTVAPLYRGHRPRNASETCPHLVAAATPTFP